MTSILEMNPDDIPAVTDMAQVLYREEDGEMLRREFQDILLNDKETVFVAKEQEELVGFLHMALRYEYVEGAGEPPVAYMEGIYIAPAFRKQNIARQLTQAGEKWAQVKGCRQIASEAEIENISSQDFHQKIGFREVNCTVSFSKDLNA